MRIYFFLILFSFYSCAEKPVFDSTKPSIKQDELSAVLAEFHLMEAHINQTGINLVTYKDSLQFFKSIVLQNHGINEEDFNQSLTYYAQFPKSYKALYAKVKEKLLAIELNLPDIDLENYKQETDTLKRNPILSE